LIPSVGRISVGTGKDRGARRLAWEVLWRTHKAGAYADLLLTALLRRASHWAKVDRALATELVFGTLRWQASVDRALEIVSERPLALIDPRLLVLLRVGAYQILFLSRIPPSASVNESVEMAKGLGLGHAAGFVNAVLRGLARRGRDLLAVDPSLPAAERIAQATSHPLWMVERWISQWGEEEASALCEANNQVAPLMLRTNTLVITREELSASLDQEGVSTEPTDYSPEGLRVTHLPVPLETLGSFQRGEFQVQDEASQLMAHWLEVSAEDYVLDACAAPGGKATHLAQLMGGRGVVVATDLHEGRLSLLARDCKRLGIRSIRVQRADMVQADSIPSGPFDRILLDAPCSALGVLRRHPDTKWRRKPEDVQERANNQLDLVRAVLPRLRPGGILLYCVCTHTPEETEGVLERMLRGQEGVRLLTSAQGLPVDARALVGPDGVFTSLPHRHGIDGYGAFRLERL
jgi:16S rRNA (cytosine967-C5)-methyltransferase